MLTSHLPLEKSYIRNPRKRNPLTLFWRSGSCISELKAIVSLGSFHLHLCPAALPLQYYFSLWAEHAIAVQTFFFPSFFCVCVCVARGEGRVLNAGFPDSWSGAHYPQGHSRDALAWHSPRHQRERMRDGGWECWWVGGEQPKSQSAWEIRGDGERQRADREKRRTDKRINRDSERSECQRRGEHDNKNVRALARSEQAENNSPVKPPQLYKISCWSMEKRVQSNQWNIDKQRSGPWICFPAFHVEQHSNKSYFQHHVNKLFIHCCVCVCYFSCLTSLCLYLIRTAKMSFEKQAGTNVAVTMFRRYEGQVKFNF